jgi:hypothetical protein
MGETDQVDGLRPHAVQQTDFGFGQGGELFDAYEARLDKRSTRRRRQATGQAAQAGTSALCLRGRSCLQGRPDLQVC